MATRPEQPFKLQQTPLMKVYEGTRPYSRAAGDDYGFGLISGGEEKFYHDELGNEVTGFDPKTHSVIGTLGEENVSSITGKKTYQRIRNPEGPSSLPAGFPKFGPAYSGPLAPNRPPHTGAPLLYNGDPYKPLDLGSLMRGGSAAPASPAAAPAAAPADAVRASAAGPAPQLSIAEQQAADIRKSGGMTASDFDRENVAIGNTIYKEGYGVDITTPEGRLKSRKDAYGRIRPNALQGAGVREFKRPDGSTGAYSTLPDAIIPESTANGHSGTTYRERAYGKHFATPEPTGKVEGWFGGIETPMIRSGGNWTGNNPVTGEFKDPEGNIWTGEKAFDNSQLGESGMVETDGIPMDNAPYTPTDEEVAARIAAGKNYDNLTAAVAGNERRLRALKGKTGVIGADGKRTVQSIEPTMSTEDYVRQGINMEAENKDSKVPASWNNWNEKTGGNVNGVWMSPSDSEPEAGGNYGTPRLFNTWTPQAGGRFNGVNMSRADSEPQAGGNYGTPDLIRRMTNTWTPEAGGMYNGQHMSRADSEPSPTGNYGIPKLLPSRTRKIFQPSRASLLRATPNYDTRGYNGQM